MTGLLTDGGTTLVIAGLGCFAIAIVGGSLTRIDGWYSALAKPWYNPPNWVFPLVWAAIYVCGTIGIVIGWTSTETTASRQGLSAVLGVNAAFNLAWSPLFFWLRRPDWALIEIVLFWLSIVLLMGAFASVSPLAGLFFAPYLVWVTIAAAINRQIVLLNKPFGVPERERPVSECAM
jgi:translocator protein